MYHKMEDSLTYGINNDTVNSTVYRPMASNDKMI
jgi:hypothetical protein